MQQQPEEAPSLEPRAALAEALVAIVHSAELQPSLFVGFDPTPSGLAADFDHFWRVTRDERLPLTHAQLAALKDVADQLAAMSTGADRRNWTDEAMRTSPAWVRLRHLAAVALQELGGTPTPSEAATSEI